MSSSDVELMDEEGFLPVQNGKRRRVSDSEKTAKKARAVRKEVSKETKVFISVETKKLNPVRVQRQVSELVGRKDVRIISRDGLLIVLVKNDAEIAKLSQVTLIDGIAAKARVAARPKHCIVGVPSAVDDETKRECSGCESAVRVLKSIGGKKEATSVLYPIELR